MKLNSLAAQAAVHMVNEQGLTINETARRLDVAPGAIKEALAAANATPRDTPSRYVGQVVGQARAAYRGDSMTFVSRDPCGRCGVRRDIHDSMGCNRWRPGP